MGRYIFLVVLIGALVGTVFFSSCSGSLPSPTAKPPVGPSPTPSATFESRATATPLATSTSAPPTPSVPAPTATGTPSSGFFRDAELGFMFRFPEDWSAEKLNSNLPAVIISDNDDPVKVMAGAKIIEDNLTLEAFASQVKDDLGLAESVELLASDPVTLADGTAAHSIALSWENEAGAQMSGKGYATTAGGKGFLVLLFGRSEVIEARPQTVEAIASSLQIEQPELFGISRENAIVMALVEPATLDPAVTSEKTSGIIGHIFSGLFRLDQNLQLLPDLAENWNIDETGSVYTFFLRPEARFHDGKPITAVDVRNSWERATDPQYTGPMAGAYLGDIIGVEEKLKGEAEEIAGLNIIDDHTLEVTLDGPKPFFLSKLAQPVTFVVDQDNVSGGIEWWRQPNGSGPFTLRSWRPGTAILLDRYDDYLPSPPMIESVVYLVGEGSLGAYEAGAVDAAPVAFWNLSRVQEQGDPLSPDLHSSHSYCTRRVVFNLTEPPFDDPAIRQAFSLAIDRENLSEQTLSGSASPATGILPPGMPGHTDRSANNSFDLSLAQRLISESSYGSAAAIPSIKLVVSGSGAADSLSIAVADAWRNNLGIEADIQLVDPSDYREVITDPQENLFFFDWCADYPDPENILDYLFHSDGPGNLGGYTNIEVDKLLESARVEQDNQERLKLYIQAEELILADSASIELVHPETNLLVRPFIKGFSSSPINTVWLASVSIDRGKNP